ncbi:MAG: hypothetical protein IMW91_08860 [Firmicutes bacterium]|nr:hypothetical protein [Bacillota bacterium]
MANTRYFSEEFNPKDKVQWFSGYNNGVLEGETFDGSLQSHPMGLSHVDVYFYFNPKSAIVATTGPAFSAASQKTVPVTGGEKSCSYRYAAI